MQSFGLSTLPAHPWHLLVMWIGNAAEGLYFAQIGCVNEILGLEDIISLTLVTVVSYKCRRIFVAHCHHYQQHNCAQYCYCNYQLCLRTHQKNLIIIEFNVWFFKLPNQCNQLFIYTYCHPTSCYVRSS